MRLGLGLPVFRVIAHAFHVGAFAQQRGGKVVVVSDVDWDRDVLAVRARTLADL